MSRHRDRVARISANRNLLNAYAQLSPAPQMRIIIHNPIATVQLSVRPSTFVAAVKAAYIRA